MSATASPGVRALADALPAGAVSVRAADLLAASVDLWPRHLIRLYRGERFELPAAVVWPRTTAELACVVQVARAQRLALVPYGAGSSVVGGATPEAGQVVLDLKRMQRLLEIDRQRQTATAECGIIGELFERALARRGLTQGHFPSSIYCSTLGGWIAAKSAGQMSSRYGKIEDQLLGGTVVLGDGRVLRQHPSVAADPTWQALIGAEGALGVFAEATVRVHRLPAARAFRGLMFPSLERAVLAVQAWLAAGLNLAVVRIYDPLDTLLQRQTHAAGVPHDRGPSRLAWLGATLPRLLAGIGDLVAGGCQCIVAVQGDQHSVEEDMERLVEIAERHSAADQGSGPGEAWYARRYAISYNQSRTYRAGVAVDTMEVACAWTDILETYKAVRRAALAAGAQVLAHFSHVYVEGGSIYFTFALAAKRGTGAYDALWRAALGAALAAGANVSHHHGTGRLKAEALRAALGGASRLWAPLKACLDPQGVLNPGRFLAGESGAAPRWGAHDAGVGLAVAPPSVVIADLERELRARGQSLGPAGGLCGAQTLGAAARAGALWRYNRQLRVVEPQVVGVDGAVAGERHRYIPGPRSAMGPDLTASMLAEAPERLWLRTEVVAADRLAGRGPVGAAFAWARDWCRAEATGGAPAMLLIDAGEATVQVAVDAAPSRDLVERWTAGLARHGLQSQDPVGPVLPALSPSALRVAGVFADLAAFATAAAAGGARLLLPWLDPVGGVGFADAAPALAPDSRARLAALAAELHLQAGAVFEAAADAPATGGEVLVAAGAGPVTVGLKAHRAALDNCTYCPKLCRFACPVAVASGSETYTPRQLMASVGLARDPKRGVDAEILAPIWACSDCRGCKSYCDHGNDVAEVLTAARAELFAAGAAPRQVQDYCEGLRRTGRPGDRPPDDDVVTPGAAGAGGSTLLFLGCQNRAADPGPAAAALALARHAFADVALVSGPIRCCGHPLWRWGDRVGFAKHARRFAAQLQGARQVVVDDPGCAYALSRLYPAVGVRVPEILTTTALLRRERFAPAAVEPWAPFDDPFARRYLGEPALREQMARWGVTLPAGSVLEGSSGCTGGMLLATYDPELAREVARGAARDLLAGGARRILMASPTCRRALLATGAEVDDLVSLWHACRE